MDNLISDKVFTNILVAVEVSMGDGKGKIYKKI
jgi:hypothetical protein